MLRRSCLIMPAHVQAFVEKAHLRDADAIMLDLEDSVPAQRKQEARAALGWAVPHAGQRGADVLVRINRPWELAFDDLDAAVIPGVAGIHLPKVERPEDVYAFDRLIEDRERRRGMPTGSVELSVAVETARGVLRDAEIAAASTRLRTLSCGIEDLATDLGVEPSDTGIELFWAKARIVLTARANDLVPVGLAGRISDYRDLAAFRRAAERARALGYAGASCIHPDQVPVLNEVFSPSEAELAWARSVVAEAGSAETLGRAAFGVEGRMADIPTVTRARQWLERAALVQRRDEQKRADAGTRT